MSEIHESDEGSDDEMLAGHFPLQGSKKSVISAKDESGEDEVRTDNKEGEFLEDQLALGKGLKAKLGINGNFKSSEANVSQLAFIPFFC